MSVALKPTVSSAFQGVGLLEILVTMLLLSVGLLGFIGLQTLALQAERSAFYRASASVIATDAAERIRANRAGLTVSGYASSVAEKSDSCFEAAGCSPESLAQAELYELQGRAAEVLPSGILAVCLDSTPNDGSPTGHACNGSNSTGRRSAAGSLSDTDDCWNYYYALSTVVFRVQVSQHARSRCAVDNQFCCRTRWRVMRAISEAAILSLHHAAGI